MESSIEIVEKDKALGEYGISIPPGLLIEKAEGIGNCFLASSGLSKLKKLGWDLIKCDQKYAIAVMKDTIGLPENSLGAQRQPLILTILQTSRNEELVKRMQGLIKKGMNSHIQDIARDKFKVAKNRFPLHVFGLIEPTGKIHDVAIVSLDEDNMCEFNFPDNILPQTICYARVGNIILKVETNSTDFEGIQNKLAPIMKIDWGTI